MLYIHFCLCILSHIDIFIFHPFCFQVLALDVKMLKKLLGKTFSFSCFENVYGKFDEYLGYLIKEISASEMSLWVNFKEEIMSL